MVKNTKTLQMVQLAILTAIMAVMAFTPIGYLKVAALSISFMTVPVIIGAVVLGPAVGAILGAVFGITSFLQSFLGDPFAATLLTINPFYLFILCMVPRILMGWLVGVIFKAIYRVDKTKLISFGVAGLSGALLNTVLFMSALVFLFGNSEYIKGFQGDLDLFPFLIAFVGINGLVEALVCCFLGMFVSKVLFRFNPANKAS